MCDIAAAPVSSQAARRAPTQTDSAAAGIPRNQRVEVTPSRINPPSSQRNVSSAQSPEGQGAAVIHHLPRELCRSDRFPSSETATIPAPFIAAISAMASPLLPPRRRQSATHGRCRDFRSIENERVTEALSFTGFVFAMQHTAVNPRARARVPVSMVSKIPAPVRADAREDQ